MDRTYAASRRFSEQRRRSSTIQELPDLTKMWSNSAGTSVGLFPGRRTIGPLLLMVICPVFVMVNLHVLMDLDGSLEYFWTEVNEVGFVRTMYELWPSGLTSKAWIMILIFMAVELAFMVLLPGKKFCGPTTPAGNVPVYKANGFLAYVLTVCLFFLGWYFGLYHGGILYDNLKEVVASMNGFALALCLGLYFKGLNNPSSSDSGSSGNPIFDFYWGTELYPMIFGWNVKHFVTCRCGMMFWPVLLISSFLKQYELYGQISDSLVVNIALQLVYITKFYIWENGYLCSIDIMHDRAGFYLCWGILVFLPCVYASHTLFLVDQPVHLGLFLSLVLFSVGVALIAINYDCDRQRQRFRAVNGKCKIWGRDPLFIEAKYKTEAGEVKSSILLACGWWGFARHFHYLPEIGAAMCWTIPVWSNLLLPYLYVPYLVLLLIDRAFRDDARCRSKYGRHWEQYCRFVPHVLIPGVF